MSGTIQSEYVCNREDWDRISDLLHKASLHIEQKGTLGADLFLEVKSRKDGARGVWLAVNPKPDTDKVGIEMHWVIKTQGGEPQASFSVAVQVEKLLLSANATCIFSPVQSIERAVR